MSRNRSLSSHRYKNRRSKSRSIHRYRERSRSYNREHNKRGNSYTRDRIRSKQHRYPRSSYNRRDDEKYRKKSNKYADSSPGDKSSSRSCSFGSRPYLNIKKQEPQRQPEESQPLDEEAILMRSMGFGQFASTKNKDHLDSDAYGVNKKSKRKYRQYMNRKGGFNRPLDAVY